MKNRRLVCLLTAVILLAVQTLAPIEIFANENVPTALFVESQTDNKKSDKIISDTLTLAETDGAKAAKSVNAIEDDATFDKALREVLNLYYGEEGFVEQAESFKENIDKRADKLLADYQSAYEERKNEAELSYAAGRIVVAYKSGVDEKLIDEMTKALDGTVENTIVSEDDGILAVTDISLSQTVDRAVEDYSALGLVEYAEPDYIYETCSLPNDELVNGQWYLDYIEAQDAWDEFENTDFVNVKIAVIDTGFDVNNAEFKNVYSAENSVDITAQGYPKLSQIDNPYYTQYSNGYHGTEVASIIAAEANNSIGIAGVCAGVDNGLCTVMGLKVMNDEGIMYNSAVIEAIDYAMDNGADVINMSLGSAEYSQGFELAVERAYESGVAVVAAAGNEQTNGVYYPSDYNHCISVVSLKSDSTLSSFSNYGIEKDIAAPGSAIMAPIDNNSFGFVNGTSFAAPMVSAVIGLMISINPDLTLDEIEQILYASATDLGSIGKDSYFANGALNAKQAVLNAKGYKREVLPVSTTHFSSNSLKKGTYTNNIYSDGFTIVASAAKNVEVQKTNITLNSVLYNFRLKINGAGTEAGRYITFTVDTPSELTIRAASTNNSPRTLKVIKGDINGSLVGTLTLSNTPDAQTIKLPAAGTYTICSANSGIYVYDIFTQTVQNTASSQLTCEVSVDMGIGGTVSGIPTGRVNIGDSVTLTATANTGYTFESFTNLDGTVVSTSPSYTFTVFNNTRLIANFTKSTVSLCTLKVNAGTGGTVSGVPTSSVERGTSVTITATPDSGYQFES